MKKKTLALGMALATILVAALPGVARADDEAQNKWYFAPMLYGSWLSDAKQVDDDWSYGLAVGKNFGETFSTEFGWIHGNFDGAPNTGDLKLDAFSVDALVHFYRSSRLHPFFSVGAVYTDGSRKGSVPADDGSGGGVQAGLGLMSNLYTNPARTSVVSVRAEIKNRWLFVDTSRNQSDFLAGIGLQFHFGSPLPVAAPIVEETAPVAAPPADSDGDGVIDPNDKCPNTPAGVKVDANGCELDSDGDGVVDSMDKCPDTKPGTRVGKFGCDCDVTVRLQFKIDSAELTDADKKTLDGVAENLKRLYWISGVAEGHTDSTGSDAHNQKLSERRAAAVMDYLNAKGVGETRMTAVGYGESKPIADNATKEGRAENRRVVLRRTDCDEPK